MSGEPEQAGRVPDFFVVGHGKTGTTALYGMLSHHPEVYVSAKEPRYFCTELRERDIPRPGGTPQSLGEYRMWFARARAEQTIGDVSPWYLWSRAAPALIAEAQPGARIIATLREPASFLRSLHLQFIQNYVESETDFAKALALEPERRAGRRIPSNTYWPRTLLYSDHVRYTEQLRRYRELFGDERMLVLIYDDFRADNEGTMQRVLRFIGVDETVPLAPREYNPSVQVRSQRMHSLIRSVSVADGPVSKAVKASVKTLTPARLRRRTLRATRKRAVFGTPQEPDEQLMLELRRRFKGEVEATSEYLGRDLVALWGYEDL